MNRRRFLAGACLAGSVGLAGCLERLGFEEESAWRDPPLVEDRPDAVYVPAASEEMGRFGSATDGEYAIALSYTFPHRFWNVRAGEVSAVPVEVDDSLHLMLDVWDPETRTTLPVDAFVEIRRDGELVEEFTPWPMLSQRMGFHYGDNLHLPEEGTYTARVRVGPVSARTVGAFTDRFASAGTVELDFAFERAAIHDLSFDLVDHDERGSRGALPLMTHDEHERDDAEHDREHRDADDSGHDHGDAADGDHDHDDLNDEAGRARGDDPGPPPAAVAPAVEDLPGTHLGTERSGDADVAVLETDADQLTGEAESYLAVSPRTPYNEIVLPLAAFSATVGRDGEVVDEVRLRQTLHEDYGYHYGAGIDALEPGDEVTITVDSPPQATRHDGYETAFLSFDDVVVRR